MFEEILKATWETGYMVVLSTFFALIVGFIIAIALTLTAKDGLKPNKGVYSVLDFIVNIL